MSRIEINRERCKGCGLCILYCRKGCIQAEGSINKKGAYPVSFLDKDKRCTGCSFCAIVCPEVCVRVYK